MLVGLCISACTISDSEFQKSGQKRFEIENIKEKIIPKETGGKSPSKELEDTSSTYDKVVNDSGWYYSKKLSENGLSYNEDLVRFVGDLYYDCYTHNVWVECNKYSGGYIFTQYPGPHGNYCQYNPNTKKLKEIGVENGDSAWYEQEQFSEKGFRFPNDLIQFAGNLYYDRYTHIVWIMYDKRFYVAAPYTGPHGQYCQYNPDTKKLKELGEEEN